MVTFDKIKEELVEAWKQVGVDYKKDRIINEMDVVASFYHHLRSWLDKDESLRMFTNLRVSRDHPNTRKVRNIDCALVEYNLSEEEERMFNRFLLMLEFKCKINYQRNYYRNVIEEDINRLRSFHSSNWYFWEEQIPNPEAMGLFVIDDSENTGELLANNGYYNSSIRNSKWLGMPYLEGHGRIEPNLEIWEIK